jgi:hypothetical protein
MQKVLVAAALLGMLLGILGLLLVARITLRELGSAVGHVNPLWIIIGAFLLLAIIAIAVGLVIFFVRTLRD